MIDLSAEPFEPRQHNGLPIFSSSEEVAYKTCKLGHYFEYVLGYRPAITNRKLSVGIHVHEGLEGIYTGLSDAEIKQRLHDLSEERWAELEVGFPEGVPAETRLEYMKDRDLVLEMVLGYRVWALVNGVDDGYETVEVESQHYIEVPGAPCVMPIKLDLLQRNTKSGRLRIIDFKTAASFVKDFTKFQLAEQNGNYQLGIFALYGERPTELVYRELRKIKPSGQSKPPYYREIPIRLTAAEMRHRAQEYIATAIERFGVGSTPIANPSACCGSWKNDWQSPCMKVHQGMQPLPAIEASPRYRREDTYARYDQEA